MIKRFINAALAAVLFGAISAAHAVPTLTLWFQLDGGTPIDCVDQSTCDLDPTLGAVTYVDGADGSKELAAFAVSVTAGASKPVLKGTPLMDVASFDIQALGGNHELIIMLSDTSFSNEGPISAKFGGTLDGGTGTSIVANAYYDTANALFGTTSLIGQIGPFGPGMGGFAGSFSAGDAPAGLYSVTQVLTLRTAGAATFSGDFAISVPEPTTLALMGLGLVGFAAIRRRRQTS